MNTTVGATRPSMAHAVTGMFNDSSPGEQVSLPLVDPRPAADASLA